MKYLFLIFMKFIMVLNLYSKDFNEYKFNWYPRIIVDGDVIVFPDSSKYKTYNTSGVWENNLGNYGINKCLGTVKKMPSNKINLNIICESIDKNGYKTWLVLKRSSSSMESGVGYAEIVDSTVPHKELWIGTKCTYTTNYLEDVNFTIQKCTVSDKLYKAFLKLINK